MVWKFLEVTVFGHNILIVNACITSGTDESSKQMDETWDKAGQTFENEQEVITLKLIADR